MTTNIKIEAIDHLVLTVSNIETSCRFYCDVLGMETVIFGDNRRALKFGNQKINLHTVTNVIEPKARHTTTGSSDICLLTSTPLAEVIATLNQLDVNIIDGPVQRTGATGPIQSVYIRDPDGNLIEISSTTQ